MRRATILLVLLDGVAGLGCSGETRALTIVNALPDCASQASGINHVQLTALGDFPPAPTLTVETTSDGKANLALPSSTKVLEIDGLGMSGLLAFGRTAPSQLSDLLGKVEVSYGPPDTLCAAPVLFYARAGHLATLLSSGAVLISGGHTDDGFPVPKMERYEAAGDVTSADPGFRVVDPNGPTQIDARAALGHAVAVLTTNDLMISGGVPVVAGEPLGPAYEGYSHHDADGVFIDSQVLGGGPRAFHTATVLADGSVVLAGGCQAFDMNGCTTPLDTSEIYQPATGKFSDGPPLAMARFGHQALLRGDGKILLVGGGEPDELFDPATGGTVIGTLPGPAATLPAGGILSIGGSDAELWLDGDGIVPLAPLPSMRSGHTVDILDDGTLLVAGGGANGLDSALLIYDPLSGARTLPGPFARRDHTATRLNDGSVLLAGGSDESGVTTSAAIFLHSPLGPYSNLATLTFDALADSKLSPRRPDRVSIDSGHAEIAAGAAASDGRPVEWALVQALTVDDFTLQLSVGADDGASAAVLAGWVDDAHYGFITLGSGQPITFSSVTPAGVALVKGCSGVTLEATEIGPSPSPLLIQRSLGHLFISTPARRLLECGPGSALPGGAIGIGSISGTVRFDDLSLTR